MIIFNGINSDSIGVIVERIPNRYTPARRTSLVSVPGRNGDVPIVDESFPNIMQRYEVYYSGEFRGGLPEIAHAAAEWLLRPTGYAELSDSYDPSITRSAMLIEGFDIENVMNLFGRCEIAFSCAPQGWLESGKNPVIVENGGSLTNPTIYPASPLIEVQGTGSVVINGYLITIKSNPGILTIDGLTGDTTADGQAADSMIECDEFPKLTVGENEISYTSGITSLTITPRWWKL